MQSPDMSIMSWRLINIACISAAIVQLGFILESFIKPTLLNTSVKEIDLQDIDFPIEIKICAQPGFNETALEEMGYEEGIWSYFYGKSRFNSSSTHSLDGHSIIGWAGHTADFGVKSSVEEVLNKMRNHRIKDIINSGKIQFRSGKYQNVSMEQFHLADRVNYPHNCFRLNLTFLNEIQEDRINTLEIYFNANKTQRIQLDFHGGSMIANRDIYDDTFGTTGDAIVLDEPGTYHKYAVEISGNSYLEDDTSKKCRDYPNSEYASYKECDDQYMRDICKRVGLAPVWLFEDFSQVTQKAVIDDTTGLDRITLLRVKLLLFR